MTTTKQVPPKTARSHYPGEHSTSTPHLPRRGGHASRLAGTHLAAVVDRWRGRYSLTLPRISMGAVIFGFGVLKYFPGVSPAQDLALSTTRVLSFGLMPAHMALVLLATAECGIGLSLITGRARRHPRRRRHRPLRDGATAANPTGRARRPAPS